MTIKKQIEILKHDKRIKSIEQKGNTVVVETNSIPLYRRKAEAYYEGPKYKLELADFGSTNLEIESVVSISSTNELEQQYQTMDGLKHTGWIYPHPMIARSVDGYTFICLAGYDAPMSKAYYGKDLITYLELLLKYLSEDMSTYSGPEYYDQLKRL